MCTRLRWMIEEYARHSGHADVMREALDSLNGEQTAGEGRSGMTPAALGMVLTAAVLHAAWNLAAKRVRGDAAVFVWMYFTGSALLCVPLACWLMLAQGHVPGWETVLAPAVTAVFHIAYSVLLQLGYRHADLGIVYPVARGVGPVLSVLVAVLLLGERPPALALLGGLLAVGGILVVTGRGLLHPSPGLGAGLLYGTLAGTGIAAYTLWDDFSVTALGVPPLIYFAAACTAQSLLMLPWVIRRRAAVHPTWRADRRPVLIVSVLSPGAYVLVLYALQHASVALVAPLRESSIVIGALLAWWLFKEKEPAPRILGAAVVACGIVLVALG
nr:EamA family transporter [Sediminivirga luteola]